ncbi:MAG: Re/Si-specific NAD(P)(+) transhydrogenase subunit alpha [Parvicellaceae bacterium]
MKIGIPTESTDRETRIAMSPTVTKLLVSKGFEVLIEKGAGLQSHFLDSEFSEAGAKIVSKADAFSADVVAKINPPNPKEIKLFKKGSVLVSLMFARTDSSLIKSCCEQGISAFSLDAIPRTSLAQSMDVLSSQANLAGYKSVLLGGSQMGKIFPMLMTSAGTIKPSTVVIFGAGVAGLQAIATAKRLGANVWVSDIRPETKEQVESLGGKFIEVEADDSIKTEGGYVKGVSDEFLKKQQQVVAEKLAIADLVITTALIPGKKAPLLISDQMLSNMKQGTVIVDMAVAQGGNCAGSELNKTVIKNGVKIIGEGNLPGTMPINASELFAKNIHNFLIHLTSENKFDWNMEDEITSGSLMVKEGEIIQDYLKEALSTQAV